jgi:hypothetical protein
MHSWCQLQYDEVSQDIGCQNTSYGSGTLGGGISFFDFDNDGWDDLTISSEEGKPVQFLKNINGQFVTVDFGIVDDLFENKTVQWVDFDNDGDNDFFVTSINDGFNRLYENDGSMQFQDITETSGLLVADHMSFGSSWGDYNNDGWLDLFVCSRSPGEIIPNYLFKNNGDKTFTNVTDGSGLFLDNYLSFCAAFIDYDKDGWQDIYIANDKYEFQNLLYRNNGDGTFTEVGNEAGVDVVIDAMSTGIGDYNRDGWLDIYVTNTQAGNVFYRNNGDNTFTDVAEDNGTLMESVAWGAVFLDGENDSDLDLYVSSMITDPGISLTSAFYENNGNGYYSIPQDAGFENDAAVSFSNAIGDIDNNGYPDITVLNYTPDDVYLWQNITDPVNNWLKVKLEGVESNRQGIGSWIEISIDGQKQYNYTLCGEGYLGQNSAYEFFGLGDATSVDYIKVTWLSGIVDLIEDPEINTHHTIVEGSNILTIGERELAEEAIEIYPNPGRIFTIELPSAIETCNFSINDILGREVFFDPLFSGATYLEIPNVDSGLYYFTFSTSRKTFVKKVIIY